MAKNGLISIILLSYYSNERLKIAHRKIKDLMESENIPFQLLIMDDGSKDQSYSIACEIEKIDSRVNAYQLSRNYTSHYSAFAGLSLAIGDCAVLIPDDEQLPYNDIVKMYRIWANGAKVIIPHRLQRNDSFFTNKLSDLFYWFMNTISDIDFPKGGADSFLVDREIIDILNEKIHPIRTTTISEIIRLGYNPVEYPYVRPKGINEKSRWSFKNKIKLAKDYFYSSSTFPIKFISVTGIFFSFISVLIILIYSFAKLFGNEKFWNLDKYPGWVSIIILISFFSGIILFSLGIIAEYIWRIYEEVKNRPGYIIKKKE